MSRWHVSCVNPIRPPMRETLRTCCRTACMRDVFRAASRRRGIASARTGIPGRAAHAAGARTRIPCRPRARARGAGAVGRGRSSPCCPPKRANRSGRDGIVGSISHCEGVCAVAVAESTRFCGSRHRSGTHRSHRRHHRRHRVHAGRTAATRCDAAIGAPATPESAVQRQGKRVQGAVPADAPIPRFRRCLASPSAMADFSARAVRPRCAERRDLLHGRFFAGPHLIATAAWLPAA